MSRPATRRRIVRTLVVAAAAGTLAVTAIPGTASAGLVRSAIDTAHSYRHGIELTRNAAPISLTNPLAILTQLTYGGGNNGVGVTTGAPKVYLVFWGSQWGTSGTNAKGDTTLSNDPAGAAPIVQEFFKGLGTGGEGWSKVMTQYCEGISSGSASCPSTAPHVGYPTGGALAGVWYDNSTAAPNSATSTQLGQEAVNAAGHFGNTTAALNRNAQYAILSPTGTHPDGYNTSSTNWCAWHDWTGDVSVTSPYGDVAFSNDPYQLDQGANCGENFVNSGSAGVADGFTIVFGHEYAETITDQFPSGGWTDIQGSENGDKCAWISSGQGASQDITLTTGSFPVQSTWANDFNGGQGGCEVTHS